MKMWMMIAALACALCSVGQTKKWDGEGGDGAWTNPRNWFPDGVPSMINNVELDHSMVAGIYTVYLPDGIVPVEANSISIDGNNSDTITLMIPETNTVSPSIILYNNLISISIKNAAILVNRSGANAGNTFQMAGGFKIGNGGVYLHQTIRGTASIASKLVFDNSCSYGNFEMDVPGTAGYILSLSGRNYGTLTLNASRSGGKRSYSGSGNSSLNILGNLHIKKGASLITTLNGNIQIYGSFQNEGIVQLNPTSTDTIDRSICFKGSQSDFSNTGNLSCNTFLRKISIDSNAMLQLKTDLTVLQNSLLFELNGKLICQNYFIGGIGKFKSNKGAWISSTSPTVISSDINEGNIRCAQIEINSKTGFVFTGENTQHTGNAFPDSISAIVIDKISGNVLLDKTLHVKDSLVLLKGLLKSDSVYLLSFSGKNIKSKNPFVSANTSYNGHISGTMEYLASQNDSLFFPLGTDTSFAPCIITATSNAIYHVGFDAADHIPQLSQKFNKKSNVHWHIQKISQGDSSSVYEKLSLFTGNILLHQRENPVLIYNNNADSNWKNKPTYPFKQYDPFLQSYSSGILDGIYSIATQFAEALSNDRIVLSKNENHGIKNLRWVTNLTDNDINFIIERGTTIYSFQKIQLNSNQIVKKGNEYVVQLPNKDAFGFFRISISLFDRNMISNIVYLEKSNDIKPFPNPAFDQIHIQVEHPDQQNHFELIDMMGKKYEMKITWNGMTANIHVSHLSPGKYYIIVHEDVKTRTWPFIKY